MKSQHDGNRFLLSVCAFFGLTIFIYCFCKIKKSNKTE